MTYVEAKKARAANSIFRFTLSRYDILDYIEECAKNPTDFPIFPTVKARAKKKFGDKILCGQFCFALLYERSSVIKLVLRLEKNYAESLMESCAGLSSFNQKDDWYNLIADFSFNSKEEVFEVVKNSYNYALSRFYHFNGSAYTALSSAVQANHTANAIAETVALVPDTDLILAVAEREIAVEKFNQSHKKKFELDKERLISLLKADRRFGRKIEIIERDKPSQPLVLRTQGKTFALVYQKTINLTENLTKTNVLFRCRLTEQEASNLTPQSYRVRFMSLRNWYVVPIDGFLSNVSDALEILNIAKQYVDAEEQAAREIAEQALREQQEQQAQQEQSVAATSSVSTKQLEKV